MDKLYKVYRNVTKKSWSGIAMAGPNKGKVVLRIPGGMLYFCKFKVSEAGRQRVLKEKRKNVHAYVIGSFSMDNTLLYQAEIIGTVKYNPYKNKQFMLLDLHGNLKPITQADIVTLNYAGDVTAWKFRD